MIARRELAVGAFALAALLSEPSSASGAERQNSMRETLSQFYSAVAAQNWRLARYAFSPDVIAVSNSYFVEISATTPNNKDEFIAGRERSLGQSEGSDKLVEFLQSRYYGSGRMWKSPDFSKIIYDEKYALVALRSASFNRFNPSGPHFVHIFFFDTYAGTGPALVTRWFEVDLDKVGR